MDRPLNDPVVKEIMKTKWLRPYWIARGVVCAVIASAFVDTGAGLIVLAGMMFAMTSAEHLRTLIGVVTAVEVMKLAAADAIQEQRAGAVKIHTVRGVDWWLVLGLESRPRTLAEADAAYRNAVKYAHPDAGGNAAVFKAVKAAHLIGKTEMRSAGHA